MEPQRLKADERIKANDGMVAFRYGALVYNVETADQPDINKALGAAPLKAEWRSDLLGGVVAINGKWQDGSPMLAVPNYARMNRLDWPTLEFPEDAASINYAPGATAGSAPATTVGNTAGNRAFRRPPTVSQVWIKDQS
jgi:hypothetical protein